MSKEELHFVLEQWLNGSISDEKVSSLKDYLERNDTSGKVAELLEEFIAQEALNSKILRSTSASVRVAAILNIDKKLKARVSVHRVHFLRTAWFRVAVAIIVILSVSVYIFTMKQPTEQPIATTEQNKAPGIDKAILTLSDGRQIVLDNTNTGNISDGSISIQKADGVVKYNAAFTSQNSVISYNSMRTPRGGQYQLILPDGSKVWLNSASSIKYPIVFQGKNRVVELTGEAYFDVKENKKMPFIVKTQKAEVLVLGTQFNINSYSDEPKFSTTLVNGSVKISSKTSAKIIVPGQQAQLLNSQADDLIVKNDIDINQVIAWQKGIFRFDGVSIDVIARQLSRWYDVDVTTNNVIYKKLKLSGGITKKTPLKSILKMLEINGVKNKWKNNSITLYSNNMN
jgi:transmembrane sensor